MKTLLLLTALAFATPLYAEPATVEAGTMTEGVVRKIDAANGKITLKHDPIANLDMPPMTMVFRVQTPEFLNAVKVGDKVRFHAEQRDVGLTLTAIEGMP